MKKFGTFSLFLIGILLFSNNSQAQELTPARPDVAGWNLISDANISVRASDGVMYYLGFDLTYQNPKNENEFVRQLRLLLPFVVVKSNKVLNNNFIDTALTYVTDGAEKALLKDYLIKSDPIIEIKWRVSKDSPRDPVKLEGQNEVWFWDVSGEWVYRQNASINTLMLSENFKELDGKLVTVGQKYSLDYSGGQEAYRAHEVPHAFLIIAMRAAKGGK